MLCRPPLSLSDRRSSIIGMGRLQHQRSRTEIRYRQSRGIGTFTGQSEHPVGARLLACLPSSRFGVRSSRSRFPWCAFLFSFAKPGHRELIFCSLRRHTCRTSRLCRATAHQLGRRLHSFCHSANDWIKLPSSAQRQG